MTGTRIRNPGVKGAGRVVAFDVTRPDEGHARVFWAAGLTPAGATT